MRGSNSMLSGLRSEVFLSGMVWLRVKNERFPDKIPLHTIWSAQGPGMQRISACCTMQWVFSWNSIPWRMQWVSISQDFSLGALSVMELKLERLNQFESSHCWPAELAPWTGQLRPLRQDPENWGIALSQLRVNDNGFVLAKRALEPYNWP